MIVECEAGHRYEEIPVTTGFHQIPKVCFICGLQIVSARLGGPSTITGARGYAGTAASTEGTAQSLTPSSGNTTKRLAKALRDWLQHTAERLYARVRAHTKS
jgi:hypothetical protein